MIYGAVVFTAVLIAAFFYPSRNSKAGVIKVSWQTLAEVKYAPGWYAPYQMEVDLRFFSDTLKKLNGRLVDITGFYIPIGMEGDECALSKNPNSSCFFCGGGTIESIVMVNFTHPVETINDDEWVTLRGNLNINDTFNKFPYKLINAVYIK